MRRAVSVTERAGYIARIRNWPVSAKTFVAERKNVPLLTKPHAKLLEGKNKKSYKNGKCKTKWAHIPESKTC